MAAQAFLEGAIAWLAIPAIIEECLSAWDGMAAESVEAVLEADRLARERAWQAVETWKTAA